MFLRLVEYLHCKAIWLDEAYLSLSILRRGYGGLLDALEYGQGAPLAFLWAVRLAVDCFGAGEFALRLVPLAASLLSVPLVWLLLRRWYAPHEAFAPFLLFALAQPVVRYASEVKQYSTDLVVSLVLFLVFLPLLDDLRGKRGQMADQAATKTADPAAPREAPRRQGDPSRKGLRIGRLMLAAATGAVAVWCAFPAMFVLAGFTCVLIVCATTARRWTHTVAVAVAGIVWAGSFALNFVLLLRHNTGNDVVRSWWTDHFMPLPPNSLAELNWFVQTFFDLFRDPVGLALPGLGALAFVLGALAFWRRSRRELVFVLSPLPFALLASGVQLYPFTQRFMLFAVPALLIVMGEGLRWLNGLPRGRTIYLAVLSLMLLHPAIDAVKLLVQPNTPQGVRPAFDHLAKNWREGDQIYLFHWAHGPFLYYEIKTGRAFPDKTIGLSSRADWSYYITELEPLRAHRRVWVVAVNTPPSLVRQDPQFIITYLDTVGKRLESHLFEESSVFLYDLSAAPPDSRPDAQT